MANKTDFRGMVESVGQAGGGGKRGWIGNTVALAQSRSGLLRAILSRIVKAVRPGPGH